MLIHTTKVYHGTNLFSAFLIKQYGIWMNVQRKTTDFGRGFYITPNKKQALDWAYERAKNPPFNKKLLKTLGITNDQYEKHPYSSIPALIQFDLNVTKIQSLKGLRFPVPTEPYWCLYEQQISSFVHACRKGISHHYDFVFGPVGKSHFMKPNRITFSRNKTQLSLNTLRSVHCLSNLKIIVPSVRPITFDISSR